jgi:hypothetical protein
MLAIHFRNSYSASVCGRATKRFTEDPSEVTCKQCLRSLPGIAKKRAEAKAEQETRATALRLHNARTRERKLSPARGFNVSRTFYSKIAGISNKNDDGSDRQEIVKDCIPGEILRLVRESDNPFDSGAIAVYRANGKQLGYLPAHVSRGGDRSGLAADMDSGTKYLCKIEAITGGGADLNFGVNVELTGGARFSTPNPQKRFYISPGSIDRKTEKPSPGLGYYLILVIAIIAGIILGIARHK